MTDERKVIIDEVELEVDGSMTLIQACEEAGIEIPRFAIMNGCQLQGIVGCVWLKLWEDLQSQRHLAQCKFEIYAQVLMANLQ